MRWLAILILLLLILALLVYEFWPGTEPRVERCVCRHRRTTHRNRAGGPSYCLRSDCDCREFQQI